MFLSLNQRSHSQSRGSRTLSCQQCWFLPGNPCLQTAHNCSLQASRPQISKHVTALSHTRCMHRSYSRYIVSCHNRYTQNIAKAKQPRKGLTHSAARGWQLPVHLQMHQALRNHDSGCAHTSHKLRLQANGPDTVTRTTAGAGTAVGQQCLNSTGYMALQSGLGLALDQVVEQFLPALVHVGVAADIDRLQGGVALRAHNMTCHAALEGTAS